MADRKQSTQLAGIGREQATQMFKDELAKLKVVGDLKADIGDIKCDLDSPNGRKRTFAARARVAQCNTDLVKLEISC